MYGSDSFPLGPNGQFPKQRIGSYGNQVATPGSIEEVYSLSGMAKLPVVERDFQSSIGRVKDKMKQGVAVRRGQNENQFTPRGKKLGIRMRTVGRRLLFGDYRGYATGRSRIDSE